MNPFLVPELPRGERNARALEDYSRAGKTLSDRINRHANKVDKNDMSWRRMWKIAAGVSANEWRGIAAPLLKARKAKMRTFLILEDNPARRATMVRWLYPYGCCITVDTFDSFKKELDRCVSYDAIFLDHDLGLNAGNGVQASDLLVNEKSYDTVVIHSNNAGAAHVMANNLGRDGNRKVYVHPFTTYDSWITSLAESLKWTASINEMTIPEFIANR